MEYTCRLYWQLWWSLTGQYARFLIKKSPLEDSDLSAFQGEGVIINGEEEDEGEEEGGGAEEVPHVVIVKEVHHAAWLVQVARLC